MQSRISDFGFRISGSRCARQIRNRQSAIRNAFTLVELLIVIAILLILTAMVVTAFNANIGGDRMRSAARIAQSAFLGAKDRALHAKERRGIRLLRDASDPSLVNGFVYIQPIEAQIYTQPAYPIEVHNIDTDTDTFPDAPRQVWGTNVDWDLLNQAGFFPNPPRIRIPAETGQWYTFNNLVIQQASGPKIVRIDLTTNCVAATIPPPTVIAMPSSDTNASCEIEIGNELLPNHAPILLPSGLVIDLDWSSANVQAAFPTTPTPVNAEVMYSARGMIAGPIAAVGPLHFLLNDIQDATQNLNPIAANNKGEKLVLTLFPQTGHVQTYPIDPTDADSNGIADDLFRFAKLGSRAGQ